MPGTLTYPMYACVEPSRPRSRSNPWDPDERILNQQFATVRPNRISLPCRPIVCKTFILIKINK